MSFLLCVDGTLASCQGHTQTGSNVVTIEGKGVCRVETDSAGGLIIGPGSQNIFIEGMKASLAGDVITSHGKPPHSTVFTVPGQSKVFGGTGFAGDDRSTGFAPKPDLIVESFIASLPEIHCSGQNVYPPPSPGDAYRYCNPNSQGVYTGRTEFPEIVFSFRVRNIGRDTAQPFNIGLWEFTEEIPSRAIVTNNSVSFYPGVVLANQQRVDGLQPQESFSAQLTYPAPYYASRGEYAFGIYADIDSETTEPAEDNASQVIVIPIDNECG